MFKKIARILALATTALFCLLIAPHSEQLTAAEPLRLGTSLWVGYAGQYVAGAKNFYKEMGADVKEIYFADGTAAISAFMSQRTDVLMTTTGDLAQMSIKDPSVKAIMVIDYSDGADGIIGKISKPEEAKGKTLAREDLLFENVFLYSYLQKGKLNFEDVKITNLSAADSAAAFSAGKVDIAVTYEPYMTKAAKEGGGKVIFSSKGTNLIVDVMVTRQDVIDKRGKELAALLKGMDKGVKLIDSGNPEAISIAAKRLNVPVEETKEQLSGVKLFDIEGNKSIGLNLSNPNSVMGNLELNTKLAFQFKLTPKLVDPKSLIYDSLIKSL